MSDPITLGLVGAGVGALTSKKDPLMGAALGGLGGYFLGPMAGKLAGGAGDIAGTASAAGLDPLGAQAAQLAAQNAGFGQAGLSALQGASGLSPEQAAMLSSQYGGASQGLLGRLGSYMGEKPISGLPVSRGQMLSSGAKMVFPQQQPIQGAPAMPMMGQPTGPMQSPYGQPQQPQPLTIGSQYMRFPRY